MSRRGGFSNNQSRGPPQPVGLIVLCRITNGHNVEVLLQNRKNMQWTLPGGRLPNGFGPDNGKSATEQIVNEQLFGGPTTPPLHYINSVTEGAKSFHLYTIKAPAPVPEWFPTPLPSFQNEIMVNERIHGVPCQNGYAWVPFSGLNGMKNANTSPRLLASRHEDSILKEVILFYFPDIARNGPSPKKNNRKICEHFQRGSCRFGAACKFSHEGGQGRSNGMGNNNGPRRSDICRDFQQGKCTRANCKFSHNLDQNGGGIGGGATPQGGQNCRMVAQTNMAGSPITALAIVNNGGGAIAVVGGRTGGICMWELVDSRLELKGEIPVNEAGKTEVCGTVYEENARMMFCGMFNKVRYCIVGQGPQDLDGHAGQVRALDISKANGCVISADDSGVVRWWQYVNGGFQPLRQSNPPMTSMVRQIKAVGDFAFCGLADGNIVVWSSSTGALAGTIPAHPGGVGDMVVWNNTHLLTAAMDQSGTVRVWRIDPAVSPPLFPEQVPEFPVGDTVVAMDICTITENFAVMAMQCLGGSVRLISVPKLEPLGSFESAVTVETRGISMMPGPPADGKQSVMVFAGGADGHIRCWQVMFVVS